MSIGIIADDLTSAADGSVPFARGGYSSLVAFDAQMGDLDAFDAVAVDADSRARSAAEAEAAIARAGTRLAGRDLVVKTVDSTIRGHLAVELRAALRATGRRVALFAPAFPAAGRTTRGGRQFLDGVPLTDTAFGHDLLHPVRTNDIMRLLSEGGIGPMAMIDRAGTARPNALADLLHAHECVVADAEEDGDLERLVRAVPDPSAILWVGSPGLAHALGTVFARHAGPLVRPAAPRILIVVGSLNPVSRRQIEVMRPFAEHIVSVDAGIAARDPAAAALKALDGARRTDGDSCTVLVASTADGTGIPGERAARVADAIAEVAARIDAAAPFDGFVLTGGDTAIGVARRLGAAGIALCEEFAPGVPVGWLVGARPAQVLTKAGGFGGEAMLVEACRFLRRDQQIRSVA